MKTTSQKNTSASVRSALRVESLEDRLVMNSAWGHEPINWTPDIDIDAAGVLRIDGTLFADHVSVNYDANRPKQLTRR